MPLTVGIIERCISEARKSNYKFKIGAVIFKGSRIISSSHNYIRSCSAIKPQYRKWFNSLHAEQAAILNSGDWSKLKGCDILVMKISKTEEHISNAMPCEFCMASLIKVGIKRVYYSDDNGNISTIDIRKIIKRRGYED